MREMYMAALYDEPNTSSWWAVSDVLLLGVFCVCTNGTHHFARYPHLVKLLLVVLARFCAVVGHKNELLA